VVVWVSYNPSGGEMVVFLILMRLNRVTVGAKNLVSLNETPIPQPLFYFCICAVARIGLSPMPSPVISQDMIEMQGSWVVKTTGYALVA
jgi:hypothetical protein